MDVSIYAKMDINGKQENFTNILQELCSKSEISVKLEGKSIILDNPPTKKNKDFENPSKLKSRFQRLDFKTLKQQCRKYEDYIPLHCLWQKYITDLKGQATEHQFLEKLLKADLHGAIISVFKAKNTSFVGLQGILLVETANMFVFISENHKLRKIPKKETVFEIVLQNVKYRLVGNEVMGERCFKKYKGK